MLRFLRRSEPAQRARLRLRSVVRGRAMGGSPAWGFLSALIFTIRVARRLSGPKEKVVFRHELGVGDSIVIAHDRAAVVRKGRVSS